MDAITFEKLKEIETRHHALEAEMLHLASTSGAVPSITRTAKEASDIGPVVKMFGEYKRLLAEVAGVEEMVKAEADPELRAMALEELKELQKKRDETDAAIGPLLIPKDPNDEKNVILEIRAGTGGDEAALFAQEVFRMYQRFAERHKWKVDIVSISRAGAGGIKEVIAMIEGDKVYSKLRFESEAPKHSLGARKIWSSRGGGTYCAAATGFSAEALSSESSTVEALRTMASRFCPLKISGFGASATGPS